MYTWKVVEKEGTEKQNIVTLFELLLIMQIWWSPAFHEQINDNGVNIIEFGLQATPSNLYRGIVFFSDMFKQTRILHFIDSIGDNYYYPRIVIIIIRGLLTFLKAIFANIFGNYNR